MFVAKKSFRNFGEVIVAGSVIQDPALIKRFKSLVREGRIIEVTEHNFDKYAEYFKVRHNASLETTEQTLAREAIEAEELKKQAELEAEELKKQEELEAEELKKQEELEAEELKKQEEAKKLADDASKPPVEVKDPVVKTAAKG